MQMLGELKPNYYLNAQCDILLHRLLIHVHRLHNCVMQNKYLGIYMYMYTHVYTYIRMCTT